MGLSHDGDDGNYVGRGGPVRSHGAAKRALARVPVCCAQSTHDYAQQTTRYATAAAQIARPGPPRPWRPFPEHER
jgi:hypothetical protein